MRSLIASIWMLLACSVAMTGSAQDSARETTGRSKTILRFPNSDLPFLSITDGPADGAAVKKPSNPETTRPRKVRPRKAHPRRVQFNKPGGDSHSPDYQTFIEANGDRAWLDGFLENKVQLAKQYEPVAHDYRWSCGKSAAEMVTITS